MASHSALSTMAVLVLLQGQTVFPLFFDNIFDPVRTGTSGTSDNGGTGSDVTSRGGRGGIIDLFRFGPAVTGGIGSTRDLFGLGRIPGTLLNGVASNLFGSGASRPEGSDIGGLGWGGAGTSGTSGTGAANRPIGGLLSWGGGSSGTTGTSGSPTGGAAVRIGSEVGNSGAAGKGGKTGASGSGSGAGGSEFGTGGAAGNGGKIGTGGLGFGTGGGAGNSGATGTNGSGANGASGKIGSGAGLATGYGGAGNTGASGNGWSGTSGTTGFQGGNIGEGAGMSFDAVNGIMKKMIDGANDLTSGVQIVVQEAIHLAEQQMHDFMRGISARMNEIHNEQAADNHGSNSQDCKEQGNVKLTNYEDNLRRGIFECGNQQLQKTEMMAQKFKEKGDVAGDIVNSYITGAQECGKKDMLSAAMCIAQVKATATMREGRLAAETGGMGALAAAQISQMKLDMSVCVAGKMAGMATGGEQLISETIQCYSDTNNTH